MYLGQCIVYRQSFYVRSSCCHTRARNFYHILLRTGRRGSVYFATDFGIRTIRVASRLRVVYIPESVVIMTARNEIVIGLRASAGTNSSRWLSSHSIRSAGAMSEPVASTRSRFATRPPSSKKSTRRKAWMYCL